MTSEQLFYDKKTGFDRLTEADRQGIQTYAEGYKTFLDEAKTERDAVKEIARMAEGMDTVLVAGAPVIDGGVYTGALAGRIVRR